MDIEGEKTLVSEREQSRQGDNEKGWRETERVRRERVGERECVRERERECVWELQGLGLIQ